MRLRLREAVADIQDAVLPPDPGGLRQLAALRATLAALLSFLLVIGLGLVAPAPNADRILGFAVALFTGATVRDPTRQGQAVTMALVPLAGFATTALAALLIGRDVAGGAAIAAIAFAATWGGLRSPRGATLGIIGLIGFVIALVTRLPPETLPVRFVVLCIAAGSAALIRLVLLREDPAAEMARLRHDIRLGIAGVLGAVVAGLTGGWTLPARRALRRRMNRLAAMMLMAQTKLAAMAPSPAGLGLHLLDVELAVERVAQLARHNLGPPEQRAALGRSAAALAGALAAHRAPPLLADSPAPLGHALAVLATRLDAVPQEGPVPTVPPPAVPATAGLRPAAQAAIAVLLAVAVGQLVSPTRWYWAAFAAFVTFQGTRSRGESIRKVAQFMAGTVAGVIAGVVAAVLLSPHPLATMVAIVLAVFFAFQASQVAYGVMIFWITIILGLVFGMLGYFPPELLLLRLKETAAGAGCGVLVACVVMARPTHAVTRAAAGALYLAVGAAAEAAARSVLQGAPDPTLPGALVALESRFIELREAVRPELAGIGALRHGQLRRRMVLLGACHDWARELGRIGLHSSDAVDPALGEVILGVAARIEATVARLTRTPSERAEPPRSAAIPPSPSDRDGPTERAAHLLIRIELALLHLTRL